MVLDSLSGFSDPKLTHPFFTLNSTLNFSSLRHISILRFLACPHRYLLTVQYLELTSITSNLFYSFHFSPAGLASGLSKLLTAAVAVSYCSVLFIPYTLQPLFKTKSKVQPAKTNTSKLFDQTAPIQCNYH